jgi:hypothetical protein
MSPVKVDIIKLPENGNIEVRALAKSDTEFALYLNRKDNSAGSSGIEIKLTSGSYELKWTDTKTGAEKVEKLKNHSEGLTMIVSPEYSEDIALRLVKEGN